MTAAPPIANSPAPTRNPKSPSRSRTRITAATTPIDAHIPTKPTGAAFHTNRAIP